MSTISNTVTTVLNERGLGHYSSQAQPVIDSLESREQAALETLRSFAESKGLSSTDIDNLFVEAGFIEPTPEPEPVVNAEGGSGDTAAILASLEAIKAEITNLKAAARRHGVTV